jgi:hypothetical protein
MTNKGDTQFAAECLWPGVTAGDVRDLEERVRQACAGEAGPVRYLGAVFMPEDEVVLYMFSGSREVVEVAAQAAGVPFERLVEVQNTRTTNRKDTRSASLPKQ